MSVHRSQSSVQRGLNAAFVVQVSTQNNGSAANVSVTLTAKPASQEPTFTGGCAKGGGTATCTVSSVSDKQPVVVHAQIPVASGATSVTSVTLTATASVVTSVKWTPPSAAETVTVTSAPGSPRSAPSSPSPRNSPAAASPPTAVPLGPIPNLNGASSSIIGSSLIGAGNASGLFPVIGSSATPGSSPGTQPQGVRGNTEPVSDSSTLALGRPVFTAQLAGLLALAVAMLLTVTRVSLRKRFRSRKPRN